MKGVRKWEKMSQFQILIGILKALRNFSVSLARKKFQILIGILKAQLTTLQFSVHFSFQILIGILKAESPDGHRSREKSISNPYRYSKSDY